jgi:hypothetical protein
VVLRHFGDGALLAGSSRLLGEDRLGLRRLGAAPRTHWVGGNNGSFFCFFSF